MTDTLEDRSQRGRSAAPFGEPGRPEQPFRERALREYQESERLDMMLRLTSPRLWLALAAVLALVAAIVSWSILGSDPDEVEATGILLPEGGLAQVAATEEGIVTDVAVATGDAVTEGQQVATVRAKDGSTVEVTSEVDGRVAFVLVQTGAFITAGTLVAQLLPTGEQVDAIMFVDAGEGKLVERGMEARISPSTASASQYGSIKGRVLRVSEVPLSQARLEELVADDVVNITLEEIGELLLEVRVDLIADDTPSGYRWTSGDGPSFRITTGTPLTGTIVVGSGRPIDHLLEESGAR